VIDKETLTQKVAQAFSHAKISPPRVLVLSKRKKRFWDMQFQEEERARDRVKENAGIDLDRMVGYLRAGGTHMPCVAEVMSVPRVTEEAAKLGCKDGGSYDIENGWGCLHEELQDACLKQMETNGVDVVIVTPPCDQFSQLQNCTKRSG
jgi:hypothetical protein